MANRKVINATPTKQQDIQFNSNLERLFYNTLSKEGFNPQYEPKTFTLWEGFTPITPFYDQETPKQRDNRCKGSPKMLIPKMEKIIGIRYTPDFYIKYKDIDIWIEAKGVENDVFYIKKKLFRRYLDNIYKDTGKKSLFFEVYNKRQLLQALEIIKNYDTT